ncbi:MAG: pyruvate/2-oxoglutarate dehydrogenase complex dihydrolipoamide dehydrogenase (E3) component, partial [Gammaproteobacteria bacterium]
MSRTKALVFAAVAGLIASYFYFDFGTFFELEYLKRQQSALTTFVAANPFKASIGYFLTYVTIAALSLPGAVLLTLLGGATFGLAWGFLLISFASTIGATCAFLLSRYLFRNAVSRQFHSRMAVIDKGIKKDGAFYLFTLRLVPIFPFFIINLVMGLTTLKVSTFFFTSQLGMLPGTLVFVNAGTQLAKIDSLSGILSPTLLVSFAILGLFPLLARRFVAQAKARRSLKPFPKPANFDRNLIVIGAGSAGLVSSYIAAATKAKVTLIEKHLMGGDCLNTGCVPSKALLRSAKFVHQANRSSDYGISSAQINFEFRDVMNRVKRVVQAIEPHDSIERYTVLGVECLTGEAKILTPYCVEVGGRRLTTRNIIIASGARPFVPPIPGIEDIDYLTSDNLWDLTELPARLVVLGGGPIGCEISQAFARLGSQVTQVEMGARVLGREDEVVAAILLESLENDGVNMQLERQAVGFKPTQNGGVVTCKSVSDPALDNLEIEFDQVIVALGRRANVTGFGLEELGISLNANGTIATDAYLATDIPNIYACGDVAGPYQFTHTASHQAWYATINSLFGGFRRFAADYSVVPWCTFTDPEIARVGLSENEALEQNIPYELTTFDLGELDRALADEVARGVIRVLTVPGRDKILGVTIVGEHAGDLIAEFVLAMRHKLG